MLKESETIPLVSIGLPIYNGGKFVRTALDRIAAQTFSDYELVIVDNGSTDATSEICREYARRDPRIRYIRYDSTIPAVANFWRVFTHARGTYFLWNAADDERPAEAIERAVEAFEAHPDAVMVHGPVQLFLPKTGATVVVENAMDLTSPWPEARVAAFVGGLRHNGMLYGVYRRAALARASFRQHPGHDSLLCLQMALIGEIAYVPSPLIVYRHVYGAIADPMYDWAPMKWHDVLIYRGSRRYKCWVTLFKGLQYVARETGTPRHARVAAAGSFVAAFAARYRKHLITETIFGLTVPAHWLTLPFVRAAQRARGSRTNAHITTI